jgi:CheY-like chemotaxis protein
MAIGSDTIFVYAEDDPKSREIMRVLLGRVLGFEHLHIYEDSANFIEKLEAMATPPDVVFLDIHMKPTDGFTLLEHLREHPKFQNTVVVALTASVMNEEVHRLKTSGFDGAIAKPIDQMIFPELLERIMDGEQIWHIR